MCLCLGLRARERECVCGCGCVRACLCLWVGGCAIIRAGSKRTDSPLRGMIAWAKHAGHWTGSAGAAATPNSGWHVRSDAGSPKSVVIYNESMSKPRTKFCNDCKAVLAEPPESQSRKEKGLVVDCQTSPNSIGGRLRRLA